MQNIYWIFKSINLVKMEEAVALDSDMINKFKPSLVFKHYKEEINSLDISKDGKFLVVCSNDGRINYYDIVRGEKINTYMMSEWNSINCVKFTNHEKTILVASSRDNVHSIYYWSLHDNIILAKFLGHEAIIVSIDVNSYFSKFVSVANDESAILWDFNKVEPVAEFTEWQAAWNDNTGKVLACSHNPRTSDEKFIYLYNIDEEIYEKPFSTLTVQEDRDLGQIKTMKFSYDGKYIIWIDSRSNLFIVDAFVGGIISKLENMIEDIIVSPLVADITPCSQYILYGYNK